MNKDDVKKIKNRIAYLTGEFEKNRIKITDFIAENGRIEGAVTELNFILENLSSETEEKITENGTP